MKRDSPSLRQLTAIEFLQTETNYVQNLRNVEKFFIIPIENSLSSDEPVLSKRDLFIIINNLRQIIKLHEEFLSRLENAVNDFDEEKTCIGEIICDISEPLKQVYPKYVNYFDLANDKLEECRRENEALQSLLGDIQMQPECSKQPLEALLIRPVQRLPSISLLIQGK